VRLPNVFNSMNTVLKQVQIDEMLQMNTESERHGLILTEEDAKDIIEARDHTLLSLGRIELDIELTKKLILAFCTSPFISQEDYVSTLKELQETFYYLKNETEDEMGDDELLTIIEDCFNSSEGSLELLQGRELDKFVGDYKNNKNKVNFILEEEDE